MVAVTTILDYLDELLQLERFQDYGPNGLQVPGTEKITNVVSGVSACQELFDRAVEKNADLIIVHHGLFWKNLPQALSPIMANRLRVLLTHNINLAGYHLPLDAHPLYGNNAIIANTLGLTELQPFGLHSGMPIGWSGEFSQPYTLAQLQKNVEEMTSQKACVFSEGPDTIQHVAIVSGGGSSSLYEAIAMGHDAFITGEPTEWVMNIAREAGIHYIAAGHYATETFGIRKIGELLAQKFNINHFFVDIPNPV